MNYAKGIFTGLAAGSLLMYFADPDRGRRRRALVRDKSVRTLHRASALIDKAQRDARNRARGAGSAVRGMFKSRDTGDEVLIQRVRSKLGRLVSHPHAIEVMSIEGNIRLIGQVLRDEEMHLIRCLRAVPGVHSVDNRLEPRESFEHISMPPEGHNREQRIETMQQNWTPALRVLAGMFGGGLLSYSVLQKGPKAVAGGVAGATLLTRAILNRDLRNLVGYGDGAGSISFEKTIHIHAPASEIFPYWASPEKLPSFMTHLKEVRDLGNGKSHWVAEGPGGIPVSWDAEIIKSVQDKVLVWRSLPGALVETEGMVRFDANSDGGTRVSIRMCYKPPAGVIGHYVSSLFGKDPKSEIDDDMVRLKSLIETGKTRAHGGRVDRTSLESNLAT